METKKLPIKMLLSSLLLLLFLSPISAADLDITCTSDQTLDIVRSDSFIQIANFLPGQKVTKSIYILNEDSTGPCTIYMYATGSNTELGDKIYMDITPTIFTGTLNDFLKGSTYKIAELDYLEDSTKNISLELEKNTGNNFMNKKLSFDLYVQSQYGDDTEILGIDDSPSIGEVLGTFISLPATGASRYIIVGAILFTLVGGVLLIRKRKKSN